MGSDVTGRPRSRRDRGMTALIEGFFGFVWFGWGQANASAGLRPWLAAGGVAAALVALAGGVEALRNSASTGVLHDRLLVALGASVTAVALVAVVAGLATGVAPSTVTGVGAGTLLTGFALAALAGGRAEATPQLSSPDRRVGPRPRPSLAPPAAGAEAARCSCGSSQGPRRVSARLQPAGRRRLQPTVRTDGRWP